MNKLYIRRDEIKKYKIRLSTVQYGNNYLESLLNTDPGPYLSNGGATLELTIAAISGTMIYISFPAGGETWTAPNNGEQLKGGSKGARAAVINYHDGSSSGNIPTYENLLAVVGGGSKDEYNNNFGGGRDKWHKPKDTRIETTNNPPLDDDDFKVYRARPTTHYTTYNSPHNTGSGLGGSTRTADSNAGYNHEWFRNSTT